MKRSLIVICALPVLSLMDFFLFQIFLIPYPIFIFLASLWIVIIIGGIKDLLIHILLFEFMASIFLNAFILKDFSIIIFQPLIFISLVIAGVYLGNNLEKYLKYLVWMMLIYSSLNFSIYIYRAIIYSGDFARLRGNIAIYGGNSFQGYLFVFLLLLKIMDDNKNYYIFLTISLLNSVFFLSRGGMIINAVWLVTDLFIYSGRSKNRNKFLVALIALGIGFYKFAPTDFILYLATRFQYYFGYSNKLVGNRGPLLIEAFNWFQSNPINLFFGFGFNGFKDVSSAGYSNVHNFFLSILFENGIFSFLIVLIILSLILIRVEHKMFFLYSTLYISFEGVNLFSINTNIYSGYLLFFIILIYSRLRRVLSLNLKSILEF